VVKPDKASAKVKTWKDGTATLEPRSLLKVPKYEIFDGGFFSSKEPIWVP
jgi:hypothetical protein